MNKQRYVWLLLFYLTCLISNAQSDPSTAEKDKTTFKISVNYNSVFNYYGRTDSLRSSGLFPLAELWLGENYYLNVAPVFVNNAAASFQYAGTVATAGYQFYEENKWAGNFYFIKPFYQESTALVQSALKSQTGFTLSRLNKLINITAGADLKFSDKTDYGLTAGLDHVFRWQFNNKSVLVVNPSAYMNAGTQQFTKSFLKKTPGFLFLPGTEQLVTESAEKFNILSYEFSAPVIFASGKFELSLTPSYVIPQNLITIEGRPDLSERGKKMFYTTIGAKISF